MHKSSVREYRPDNIELALKKAQLREAKRLLAQLSDDIEVLQKRVDESKNVEIQEVTEKEEMEFKERRKEIVRQAPLVRCPSPSAPLPPSTTSPNLRGPTASSLSPRKSTPIILQATSLAPPPSRISSASPVNPQGKQKKSTTGLKTGTIGRSKKSPRHKAHKAISGCSTPPSSTLPSPTTPPISPRFSSPRRATSPTNTSLPVFPPANQSEPSLLPTAPGLLTPPLPVTPPSLVLPPPPSFPNFTPPPPSSEGEFGVRGRAGSPRRVTHSGGFGGISPHHSPPPPSRPIPGGASPHVSPNLSSSPLPPPLATPTPSPTSPMLLGGKGEKEEKGEFCSLPPPLKGEKKKVLMKSQDELGEDKGEDMGVKRGYASDGEGKEDLPPSSSILTYTEKSEAETEETGGESEEETEETYSSPSHRSHSAYVVAATDPTLSAPTVTPTSTPSTTPCSTPPRFRPSSGKKKKPRSKTSIKASSTSVTRVPATKRSSKTNKSPAFSSSEQGGAYAIAPPSSVSSYLTSPNNEQHVNAYAAVDFSLTRKKEKKGGKPKKKKSRARSITVGDDDDDDDDDDEDSEDDWGKKGNKKAVLKKNYHGVDQWNVRFQDILSHFHSSSVDERAKIKTKVKASEELTFLSQDFIHAAKTFGKIIISEVYLDDEHKTIRPVNLGGVAGGQKYVVHEILFKFAYDQFGLFKGDNLAAAKVGGHELKGLMSYFSLGLSDIHFPMMALVDYRGFRLIAMTVLPLKKGSLIYGSSDAGRTVHHDHKKFNKMMKEAGERLNLKPHLCGANPNNTVELVSPADLEGHKGTDDRYYLLDFSRTMPPVEIDEQKFPGGHLYRLFRKNFVRNYPIALCPDGFSGFCMHDKDKESYNYDLKIATEYLHNYVIPAFAERLTKKCVSLAPAYVSITREMHSFGINMRYLGRVYNILLGKVLNQEKGATLAARLVLIEACSRVLKNLLYVSMQRRMKDLQLVMEVPYRRLVIEKLNIWFAEESEEGDDFWDSKDSELQKHLMRSFDFLSFTKFFPSTYPDKANYRQCWKKLIEQKSYPTSSTPTPPATPTPSPTPSPHPSPTKPPSSPPLSTSPPPTLTTKQKFKAQKKQDLSALYLAPEEHRKDLRLEELEELKRRSSLGMVGGQKSQQGLPKKSEQISKGRLFSRNDSAQDIPADSYDVWGVDKPKEPPQQRRKKTHAAANSPFLLDKPHDSKLVLVTSSDVYSLKKYLFYDRETGVDGKVVGWWFIFDRLAELTGLIFTEEILVRIRDGTETMRVHPTEPFSLHDLISMEGRVKHMNTVSAAVGTFFQYKGMMQSQKEFAANHFCRAIESYERALADVPNDPEVLSNIASTYYLLLRELHSMSTKTDNIRFDLNADIVKDAKEYFQLAIENNPANYLIKSLFAMFLDDCGLMAEAESQFLETLETAPNFAFGLVQYAQFLVKRGAMASATAMLKRVKDLRTKVVHPLTGKEILKIFRVYMSDGTFTAVEMNALSTASEMSEHVVRVMKAKAEKSGSVELTERKLRILSLHYIDELDQGRSRPMKNEESPWLLRLSGMKEKGSKRVFFLPLRTPVEAELSLFDHCKRQVDHIQKSPAFCLTNSPDFGEERKHFSHLFSHLMSEKSDSKSKVAKRIIQEISLSCVATEIFLLSLGLYRVIQHDCLHESSDCPSFLLSPIPSMSSSSSAPLTKPLLFSACVEKEFDFFSTLNPFSNEEGLMGAMGKGDKKLEEKFLGEWNKRLFVASLWVLEHVLRHHMKSIEYFDFSWQCLALVGGVVAVGGEVGSKQMDSKLLLKLGNTFSKQAKH